jgi:hypothetical protein
MPGCCRTFSCSIKTPCVKQCNTPTLLSTSLAKMRTQGTVNTCQYLSCLVNFLMITASRSFPCFRHFALDDVHITGARNIAEACAEAGVGRLVHMSALGADVTSESNYLKSKVLSPFCTTTTMAEHAVLRLLASKSCGRRSPMPPSFDRLTSSALKIGS